MYSALSDYLSSRMLNFSVHYPMAQKSSIKAGGTVEFYVTPNSAEEFISILNYLSEYSIPYRVIGSATNTLFASDVFKGAVVSTSCMRRISASGNLFEAEAGVTLASLMSHAARCGYGGAEALWLVPGTVGGAIRGNAGAHGTETADILEYADVYFSDTGEVLRMSASELEFAYRESAIKRRGEGYVISAGVRLAKACTESILLRRRDFLRERLSSQPTAMPSLGSIFKKVGAISAGYYIERAGLKGLRVGGAEVSCKHAGFIVNSGGATHRDIMALIGVIEERVLADSGVVLEREIEIISQEV